MKTEAWCVLALAALASCAASSPRRYSILTGFSPPGDTLWAVNAATMHWQRCYITKDSVVRFIPGTDCGPKLPARWVR